MKCTFQVGDRVVKYRDLDPALVSRPANAPNSGISIGDVLTVCAMCAHEDLIGLRFAEVPDKFMPEPDGRLIYWDSRKFSPVKPLSFWVGTEKLVEKEKQE